MILLCHARLASGSFVASLQRLVFGSMQLFPTPAHCRVSSRGFYNKPGWVADPVGQVLATRRAKRCYAPAETGDRSCYTEGKRRDECAYRGGTWLSSFQKLL